MSWNPIWEEVFRSQEWGKYPDISLVKFIARNYYRVPDRRQVKILEVGYGSLAPNVWFMAREGFSVYGIDGSTTAYKNSIERLEKEGLRAELKIGDILETLREYKEDFFDAVVDIECLYSNSEEYTRCVMRELYRIVKTGGKVFSKTFTDAMYKGEEKREILEFDMLADWPFNGKGFVRLTPWEKIKEIYKPFVIESIDRDTETFFNGQNMTDEWVIIAVKK